MEQSGRSQLERGTEIGGYRIDALVSRGGMGVVYRVTHLALNRIYALKVLAPELTHDDKFRERFKREMRLAASLHHPNIVAIHYAGEDAGYLFFVMDYIQGSDLRDMLEKSGALEPERAVSLLMQLGSALDSAHSRGLVHRDVKPANVLITVRDGEERAYLTDFGIARRSDTVAGLTAQGALVGTVDYMAPEQINGAPTDARTDIYALGCVFFQMLTGKVPYDRDNSIAKLFAHVHDAPPAIEGDLAELYPTFGEVLEKAMAKQPDDRYLSAGDFARDAEAALSGMRFTGPPTQVATGDAMPAVVPPGAVETTPSIVAAEPASPEPAPAAEEPPSAAEEPAPAAEEPPQPEPEPEPEPEDESGAGFETFAPGMPAVPPAAAQPPAPQPEPQPGPEPPAPEPVAQEAPPPEPQPEPVAQQPPPPLEPQPEPIAQEPPPPPVPVPEPEPEPAPQAPPEPEPTPEREPERVAAASTAGPATAAAVQRQRPRLLYRGLLVVAVLAIAGSAVIALTSSGGSGGANKPALPQFQANASPVPTNHVGGATGSATANLTGNVLTVTVDTNGLLQGASHLLHIHAGGKGLCPPASAAKLHGGHLAISTGDGIKFYGPPEVSLTTSGDTSAASRLAFARYPNTGTIRYTRKITLTGGIPAAIRAGNAVVVVHGIDYNHNGVYDNVLGRSDLSSSFTGESTSPALCGTLRPTAGAHASTATTFVASMNLTRLPIPISGKLTPAERFWLLCHLPGTAASPSARKYAGGAWANSA